MSTILQVPVYRVLPNDINWRVFSVQLGSWTENLSQWGQCPRTEGIPSHPVGLWLGTSWDVDCECVGVGELRVGCIYGCEVCRLS